jgi:hypothetical protein
MPSTTFPDGQTLTSSAQTPDDVHLIFQPLVAQILGFDTVANPTGAYSAVRVSWQQEGQPAFGINEDVCCLAASLATDDEFARVRDAVYAPNNATSVLRQMGHTAVWHLRCTLYGPNCVARAGLILSAIALDWVSAVLANKNLYIVPEWQQPVYAPEQFQGQWWKRCDFDLKFNELVTESITADTAAGVDVTVLTDTGLSTAVHIGTP